ncbi:uncharacterized protein LOC134276345 [Saccostrea cucullata]|uniref:uncharacterized protein LOC134276345 n=1 Tax=Saccostrea cuccullata TaxID=36930 RepID=UPI002ED2593D
MSQSLSSDITRASTSSRSGEEGNNKSKKQQKKAQNGSEGTSPQEQFLLFQKEKLAKVSDYRKRKLDIMEELLQLERRRTVALEKIAASTDCARSSPPLSLSPVIKFL